MADVTARRTGDVDRDFVAVMLSHHKSAMIVVVQVVLRCGHSE